jgi:hypothetical protein
MKSETLSVNIVYSKQIILIILILLVHLTMGQNKYLHIKASHVEIFEKFLTSCTGP